MTFVMLVRLAVEVPMDQTVVVHLGLLVVEALVARLDKCALMELAPILRLEAVKYQTQFA